MVCTDFTLPVRPYPQQRESISGYILRLANANGYPKLSYIKSIKNYYLSNEIDIFNFLRLLTGHPIRKFETLWGPVPFLESSSHKHLAGIQTQYWNGSYRRWCPYCLNEDGWWHAEWMLTLQVSCVKHGILLMDTCPSCQSPITWNQGEMFKCRCGNDLRSSISLLANPSQLKLASYIHMAFSQSIDQQELINRDSITTDLCFLDQVSLPRLFQFFWLLGSFSTNGLSAQPRKIEQSCRLSTALKLNNATIEILENWPHNFHKFLVLQCAEKFPSSNLSLSLKKYVGVIYAVLCDLFKHPELHFVRHEFETFLKKNWPGTLTKRNRSLLNIIDTHPVISSIEAAAILKISQEKLSTLVANKTLHGWYTTTRSARRLLMIDRGSIQSFQQNTRGLLTLTQVAVRYCISKSRVIALCNNDLLHPVASPQKGDDHQHWMFPRSEVENLLIKLASSKYMEELHKETRSFGSVVDTTGLLEDKFFIDLINAILKGKVKTIGYDSEKCGLPAIILELESFIDWKEEYFSQLDWFTVPKAAKFLKLKEEMIYHLIAQKLLTQIKTERRQHKTFFIAQHTLQLFQKRFIWGSQLASCTGLPLRKAATTLLKTGLKPVSGPSVDHGRQYIFRKKDILRAMAGRQTGKMIKDDA